MHNGRITLPHLVKLFTENPARILNLDRGERFPIRGRLVPEAAGDVTILSTTREWNYDVNKSPSKSRNSPFNGKKFVGGPVATIVAGEIVWQA